jgi:hypothetical protein
VASLAPSAFADASHGHGIGEPAQASAASRTVQVTMHDNC